MTQRSSHQTTPPIQPELDLGQHTLFILSDESIDLVENDVCSSCLPGNILHLDSIETYRLFISLAEQFQSHR